jgi:hypothetical protein
VFAVSKTPARSELRKFGVTILVGLFVIGLLLWWLKGPAEAADVPNGWQVTAICLWGVGAVVCAISCLAPLGVARRLYAGWMTTALALGAVMTRVLFTVVFVVLLPFFALIRFRDPLRKKLTAESYWEDYDRHDATLERVSRPF